MLIVGAAFKESMVGKQYDQADEQERASVRPSQNTHFPVRIRRAGGFKFGPEAQYTVGAAGKSDARYGNPTTL